MKIHMKTGFTLAEVLITLGVIGIVAAMTMPSIIANYQKQEATAKVKKVYTILNQAMKHSEVDNEAYENWDAAFDMGANDYFNKYWQPYLQIMKKCSTYQECGYSSITPWVSQNGTTNTLNVVNTSLRTSAYLPDGILILISATLGDATVKDENIYIDINGPKKPNKAGKDYFIFIRTKNGIMPNCYGLTEDQVNNDCSRTGSGQCCAAKLAKDSWEMKADYPW